MEENEEKVEKKSFWKDKKNLAIIFLIFLVFACAGSSDTQNVSSNSVSNNSVTSISNDELDKARNELSTVNSKLEEAENTIKYLSSELEVKTTEQGEYENKVKDLNASNAELQDKVEKLEEENEELKRIKNSSSSTSSSTSSTATTKAATPTQSSNSYTVYITKTGSKYHSDGCSYLKSKISIDKNSAISSGYTACSRCNP